MSDRACSRCGFTLLELVIVLLIFVIILGLLMVGGSAPHQPGGNPARSMTMNNLRQLTIAAQSYHDVFKRLPPAFDKADWRPLVCSVHVQLLPFNEQVPLFNSIITKGEVIEQTVPTFLSPLDPGLNREKDAIGVQNFAANLRVFSDKGFKTRHDAMMPELASVERGKATLKLMTDGTDNTILFATKYGACGAGGSRYGADPTSPFAAFFGQAPALRPAHPSNVMVTYQLAPVGQACRITPLMAQSYDKEALCVGMADTTVRLISPRVSAETWNRLLQPNDGLAVGADWHD